MGKMRVQYPVRQRISDWQTFIPVQACRLWERYPETMEYFICYQIESNYPQCL